MTQAGCVAYLSGSFAASISQHRILDSFALISSMSLSDGDIFASLTTSTLSLRFIAMPSTSMSSRSLPLLVTM